MKLSTQGQHAIMSMMALAIHEGHGTLRLNDLAMRQGISLSYMEQIFARLREAGLVEGLRGPGGGYRLAKSDSVITLAEIVLVAELDDTPDKAPSPAVPSVEYTKVQQMWSELSRQFYMLLDGITLSSLVEAHKLPPARNRSKGGTASLIANMFPAYATASAAYAGM